VCNIQILKKWYRHIFVQAVLLLLLIPTTTTTTITTTTTTTTTNNNYIMALTTSISTCNVGGAKSVMLTVPRRGFCLIFSVLVKPYDVTSQKTVTELHSHHWEKFKSDIRLISNYASYRHVVILLPKIFIRPLTLSRGLPWATRHELTAPRGKCHKAGIDQQSNIARRAKRGLIKKKVGFK